MAVLGLSLLFAGAAFAHSGLKTIVVDGTAYPPFNSRIDNLLGPVRRIEWSHDVPGPVFDPVTDFSSPALACQPNPRAPLLKATARAGAEVTFKWTQIVRMHQGPILAYLGYLPTPDTKPTDVKFFKIWEQGFDASKDKWANQIAVENNNQYTVRIPSDIKSGTYILRTELLALHGNMANLNTTQLAGPQTYPYCFNIDVVGGGSASPEGVNIPGAYKRTDFGLTFSPYVGTGSGTEQNKKYVPPGPPVYQGKYEAPTGQPPVVKETGAYTGELDVKYRDLVKKLDAAGVKLAEFVNEAWPHYEPSDKRFKEFPDLIKQAMKERKLLSDEVEAFKKAVQKTVVKRFFA
jgi:lytic cellulose monooxygenase (C1-hydroxylating)